MEVLATVLFWAGIIIMGFGVIGLIMFAFGIKNARMWDSDNNRWVRKEDEEAFSKEIEENFKKYMNENK